MWEMPSPNRKGASEQGSKLRIARRGESRRRRQIRGAAAGQGRLLAVGCAHVVAAARVEGVPLEPVAFLAAAPALARPAVAACAAPDPLRDITSF